MRNLAQSLQGFIVGTIIAGLVKLAKLVRGGAGGHGGRGGE